MTRRADYVVVGSGSAGAVVAARLSRKGASVLLLEAGAPRESDFWARVPLGIAKIVGSSDHVWPFKTEPQTMLAGQQVYWPRGKLPGGSSSVNGVLWVRGDPAEFDHWREIGNVGWAYRDLLPYFQRMESTRFGDATFRGRTGPIQVMSLQDAPDGLSDAFVAACEEAGIPRTPDYNGAVYTGVGYLQLSTRRGYRSGTAVAYLKGLRNANLELLTQAVATRVLFDGRRATGVEFLQGGATLNAFANREVLICAGPLKSPQLLELSGVGNGELLQRLGIPVVHHLPGVGENLVDHLQSRITLACTRSITLNDIMSSRVRKTWMGARYLATGRGLMATPGCTAHALVVTPIQKGQPTLKLQLHHMSSKGRFETGTEKGQIGGLDKESGFSVGFIQLRPDSRGYVHIRSTDPNEDPVIDPRYFAEETDRDAMVAALRLARRVLTQPSFAPYIDRETRPGPSVQSDAEILAYIKESGLTSFHPVGTCKMGVDDRSVVDPMLRVRGMTALRVVDSSIMPTIPASNTNAASIVVGEKAADLIGFP